MAESRQRLLLEERSQLAKDIEENGDGTEKADPEAAGKENSIAVISCGRNNMYGHPAKDTINRLEASGFTIYRTDRQGAVTLELP